MADGAAPAPRMLIVGIGNSDRGDDGVGRLVARLLRARVSSDVRILEHDGEASGLLAHLEAADAVFLIDAVVSGAAPGSIKCFDCVRERLPRSALAVSTHGFGVAEAVELARALGRLPACCRLYAVEAGSVAAGAPLSKAVCAAAGVVAARVVAALRTLSDRRGSRPGPLASQDCGPC